MTGKASNTPPPLLAGRYRIGSVLGKGGMATVYHARDTRLSRSVAVKIFKGDADETSLHRFREESRLLANLDHPNLVTLFDAGSDGGQTFLVMRLIKGPTLRALLGQRTTVPPETICTVGAQLASTLSYVHSRHVLHRDIKPSNVLISEGGRPFLTDFGLARLIGANSITRSGEMVGTAAYLAPEQVRGDHVGPPGDVYSLGLVLLECLTGEMEYRGTETESALARLSRAPKIPADVPAPLGDILTAMTLLVPESRPTAATCAEWLGRLADPPGPAGETPSTPAGEWWNSAAELPRSREPLVEPLAEPSSETHAEAATEYVAAENNAATENDDGKPSASGSPPSDDPPSDEDRQATVPLTTDHRGGSKAWVIAAGAAGLAAGAVGLTLVLTSGPGAPQTPGNGKDAGGPTTVIVLSPMVGTDSPSEVDDRRDNTGRTGRATDPGPGRSGTEAPGSTSPSTAGSSANEDETAMSEPVESPPSQQKKTRTKKNRDGTVSEPAQP